MHHALIFRFAKLPQYQTSLPSTLPFATARQHLAEVDSTNSHARRLLQESQPVHGMLITADVQTAGRGQRDRAWLSASGLDITCSYILRPTFLGADRQFLLGAAVALALHGAVTELLESTTEHIRIKWPNDILIGTKKVAGILIENSLRGQTLDTTIVGIGLNVNSTDFPSGLRATSLALQKGRGLSLHDVLHVMDMHMGLQYERLCSMMFTALMANYNQRLFCRGERIPLLINGASEQVKVLGAQDSGLLNLLHGEGRVTEHAHHELGWDEVWSAQ